MLFKVSAALVLTLLSITTSASPKRAAALPRGLPGPSGITITPLDHQNYTAGNGLNLKYQGFLRVSLETAAIDVVLRTKNGLNTFVFAQDMGPIDSTGLYEATFRLPPVFHATPEEKGKPLLANLDIYEREKQLLPDGSYKFQVRYLSQAPFILINNAKYIEDKKVTS
ncbi:BQ5605_C010g06176 [Microbotryum silenes-dioicae]|uniref:BQ5605_C010g06176 protein n=1 Tax=Microbotryum silenes-dioicae TaxID=796604 RepID=A0A2X0NUR3_9BASI|nr:BQ5605_C010g06176 [Microbotryum silenes-dioicae]